MINKKILMSVFIIGLLAFGLGYGTYSYFSDTEKSTGNVFTAGIIDIEVDGQNPWVKTYSGLLSDVKPCEKRWVNFTIENVGGNPVHVWKHIKVTGCDGGIAYYFTASSEPEWTEGGGKPDETGYTERCWLPGYILYDLWIDIIQDGQPGWWIIEQEQYVRVDNINCMWIYLGEIPAGKSMVVKQSYHLSSWPYAPEPEVTNWAQGDRMFFDIELYAEQVGGVGPVGAEDTLKLVKKDPVTWKPLEDAGYLTYKTAADEFTYTFYAEAGLKVNTGYSLIYYADPWPGTGGKLIATFMTDGSGAIASTSGSVNLGMDIPVPADYNYPVGGKIWLVLSSDYSTTTPGTAGSMTGWHPSDYLFEMHLIQYDDTDVP